MTMDEERKKLGHGAPGHAYASIRSRASGRASAADKCCLGLDEPRSWVVLTEANRFPWPDPDLRPAYWRQRDRALRPAALGAL
jgi:hypothetical protein